jgi:hypothetical protein
MSDEQAERVARALCYRDAGHCHGVEGCEAFGSCQGPSSWGRQMAEIALKAAEDIGRAG